MSGRYQFIRKLATGGMAEIYLAKTVGPGGFEKRLVVKRILPHLADRPSFLQMFFAEARIAAQLAHPNIVQIFDFGEEDGSHLIAMEYVEGLNLRVLARWAKQHEPISPAVAARIVSQACEGLAYAHEFVNPETGAVLNLVHRDVSADNIMVSRMGIVKVLDFGIAHIEGEDLGTGVGERKGKIAYMPVEQLRGDDVDLRVDVFALGVVLYMLLAGERPWERKTEIALINAMLKEDPRPLEELRPDVPAALSDIVLRALARDREERFQTCRELASALEAFIAESGEPVSPTHLGVLVTRALAAGAGSDGPVTGSGSGSRSVATPGPPPRSSPQNLAVTTPGVMTPLLKEFARTVPNAPSPAVLARLRAEAAAEPPDDLGPEPVTSRMQSLPWNRPMDLLREQATVMIRPVAPLPPSADSRDALTERDRPAVSKEGADQAAAVTDRFAVHVPAAPEARFTPEQPASSKRASGSFPVAPPPPEELFAPPPPPRPAPSGPGASKRASGSYAPAPPPPDELFAPPPPPKRASGSFPAAPPPAQPPSADDFFAQAPPPPKRATGGFPPAPPPDELFAPPPPPSGSAGPPPESELFAPPPPPSSPNKRTGSLPPVPPPEAELFAPPPPPSSPNKRTGALPPVPPPEAELFAPPPPPSSPNKRTGSLPPVPPPEAELFAPPPPPGSPNKRTGSLPPVAPDAGSPAAAPTNRSGHFTPVPPPPAGAPAAPPSSPTKRSGHFTPVPPPAASPQPAPPVPPGLFGPPPTRSSDSGITPGPRASSPGSPRASSPSGVRGVAPPVPVRGYESARILPHRPTGNLPAAVLAALKNGAATDRAQQLMRRFPLIAGRMMEIAPDLTPRIELLASAMLDAILLADEHHLLLRLLERTQPDRFGAWLRNELLSSWRMLALADRLRHGLPADVASLNGWLAALGPGAIPQLVSAIDSLEQGTAQDTLCRALATLLVNDLGLVVGRLEESPPRNAAAMAFVLEASGSPERSRLFTRLFARRDLALTLQLLTGRARVKGPETAAQLEAALQDRTPEVRLHALKLLADLDNPAAARVLFEKTEDPSFEKLPDEERAAYWASLTSIRDPQTFARVGELLDEKTSLIGRGKSIAKKLLILDALGRSPLEEARALLVRVAEDQGQPNEVSSAATQAMLGRRPSGARLPPDESVWLRRLVCLDLCGVVRAATVIDLGSGALDGALGRLRDGLRRLVAQSGRLELLVGGEGVLLNGASVALQLGTTNVAPQVAQALSERDLQSLTLEGPVPVSELRAFFLQLCDPDGTLEGAPHVQATTFSGRPVRPLQEQLISGDQGARASEAFRAAVDFVLAQRQAFFAGVLPDVLAADELLRAWARTYASSGTRLLSVVPEQPGDDAFALHAVNTACIGMAFANDLQLGLPALREIAEVSLFWTLAETGLPANRLPTPGAASPEELRLRLATLFLSQEKGRRAASSAVIAIDAGLDAPKNSSRGPGQVATIVALSEAFDALAVGAKLGHLAALDQLQSTYAHRFGADLLALFVAWATEQCGGRPPPVLRGS